MDGVVGQAMRMKYVIECLLGSVERVALPPDLLFPNYWKLGQRIRTAPDAYDYSHKRLCKFAYGFKPGLAQYWFEFVMGNMRTWEKFQTRLFKRFLLEASPRATRRLCVDPEMTSIRPRPPEESGFS